jgi:hypothetical protein
MSSRTFCTGTISFQNIETRDRNPKENRTLINNRSENLKTYDISASGQNEARNCKIKSSEDRKIERKGCTKTGTQDN